MVFIYIYDGIFFSPILYLALQANNSQDSDWDSERYGKYIDREEEVTKPEKERVKACFLGHEAIVLFLLKIISK